MSDERTSLVDQMRADPRGRAELALASFENALESLFFEALATKPDVSEADAARIMGVPSERVHDLWDGAADFRPEAVIRYLSLLGFTATVALVPDAQ
jgi:hypothetical protein